MHWPRGLVLLGTNPAAGYVCNANALGPRLMMSPVWFLFCNLYLAVLVYCIGRGAHTLCISKLLVHHLLGCEKFMGHRLLTVYLKHFASHQWMHHSAVSLASLYSAPGSRLYISYVVPVHKTLTLAPRLVIFAKVIILSHYLTLSLFYTGPSYFIIL